LLPAYITYTTRTIETGLRVGDHHGVERLRHGRFQYASLRGPHPILRHHPEHVYSRHHPDCTSATKWGRDHPECPERLGAINDMLLTKGLLDYMASYDAEPATEAQLERAHTPATCRSCSCLAPEGYHQVDPDTSMNPHTALPPCARPVPWCRPPTWCLAASVPRRFATCAHPATMPNATRRSMGFCFFNNVAVGIMPRAGRAWPAARGADRL
jgi:acetoin utilization deacetylase AcuC-like enzyme